MFERIDKWLSATKDWHIAVSIFIFMVGSVQTWFGHINHDYVAFTGLVLGAITGHAFSNHAD